MASFSRGDVVVVDLGMAAKVRPCVVVSVGQPDRQRNMSVVAPKSDVGGCELFS
jgi:mRNA-degrading endonuclease toxin of MazEF toxin-antitoxin module